MDPTASATSYESPSGELYDPAVAKMQRKGVEDARKELGGIVTAAGEQQLHTVIARHGADKAVVVDIDWYRRAREALGDPTEM